MTLAELLALLPDNDTGEISASDMRTIITELFNDTAQVASDLAAMTDDVTDLGTQVSGLSTEVAGLAFQVASLDTDVSDLTAALAALDDRVDNVEAVNDTQATQIAGLTTVVGAFEGTIRVTGIGGTGHGGSGTENVAIPTTGTGAPANLLDGNPHLVRFAMLTGEPSANLVTSPKRVRFDPGADPLGWVQGDNTIAISGANMKNWVDSNTTRTVQYNVAGRYLQVVGFNDSSAAPE